MREPVERLQKSLDYYFSDLEHLELALTHRSIGSNNNERSEFLGDSILGFVIADLLYHRFKTTDEGHLSRLRASLVKKETLAEIARQLSLGKYLKLGQGELRSGGQSRDSTLSDTVEAIIAAIYLDGGYEAARKFIIRLYRDKLDRLDLNQGQKDPKTRLQEILQSRKLSIPVYELVSTEGPEHNQVFKVRCEIADAGFQATGSGTSKRKAEQAAASLILEQHYND